MPEYVQFLLVMIFFIAVLIGSYWFVPCSPEPTGRREERWRAERERRSG